MTKTCKNKQEELHAIKIMKEPWIKLKSGLNQEDYDLINGLQMLCSQYGQETLKLELDYKRHGSSGIQAAGDFYEIT